MTARPQAARVLLVDDAPHLRRLVRDALEERGGFDVVGEAASGAEAVELVGELEPELVVLDLGLPDLAGRDVLTRIRDRRPEVKVVIFSGVDADDQAWFAERTEGHVVKDADVRYVVDLLQGVVTPHRTWRASIALPQDLRSIRDARRFVATTLAAWRLEELGEEAALVVTELAANAVLHAGSDYEVRLALKESTVRIEVSDHGPGTPDPRASSEGGESGRGLFLVSALSTSWGVDAEADQKIVWSELGRRPPGPRPSADGAPD